MFIGCLTYTLLGTGDMAIHKKDTILDFTPKEIILKKGEGEAVFCHIVDNRKK